MSKILRKILALTITTSSILLFMHGRDLWVQGVWKMYGKDASNTRNNPSSVITPENVSSLTLKWTFHDSTAATGAFIKNPAVDGDSLFLFDAFGGLYYKLDRSTGKLIWKKDINETIKQCVNGVYNKKLEQREKIKSSSLLYGIR